MTARFIILSSIEIKLHSYRTGQIMDIIDRLLKQISNLKWHSLILTVFLNKKYELQILPENK